MIGFKRYTLENGLKVIVHEDDSTTMAVVNIMYNVGARNEEETHTGFAHLFEHLMFGGSANVPDFDEPLQRVGGENNAYTTNDLTNYYEQLPAANIETAFWLESDRMLHLNINQKSLDVQRKVVSEEFKENYLNKPYGDLWKIIREQAYSTHPYKWMTIGKELSHIEKASLEDVKDFFHKFYTPSNAIIVVAGNVNADNIFELVKKWFGDIPEGEKFSNNIKVEPIQREKHELSIERDVPMDVLVKSWHMCARMDPDYYATDLLSDILGGGASSRLHERLVKKQNIFSAIDCFHTGSIDAGLLSIEGRLVDGISLEEGNNAIEKEIETIKKEIVSQRELEKVKNKTESMMAFEDVSIMSRAGDLAYYELLGDANLINTELASYKKVMPSDILEIANKIFIETNSNTVYYRAIQK